MKLISRICDLSPRLDRIGGTPDPIPVIIRRSDHSSELLLYPALLAELAAFDIHPVASNSQVIYGQYSSDNTVLATVSHYVISWYEFSSGVFDIGINYRELA